MLEFARMCVQSFTSSRIRACSTASCVAVYGVYFRRKGHDRLTYPLENTSLSISGEEDLQLSHSLYQSE